ncbi:hypothetical protein EV360DRAFT_97206 [Lentinula raphanica]|nr:hypothetical protein EV360DRAFT_97206 [Lentinula raphanica]
MKHGTYVKLQDNVLVASSTGVNGEDLIIGNIAPIIPDSEELGQRTRMHTRGDMSNSLRSTDVGIRVRFTCIPQIGDKFASRHGQKDTIGITYRQEDVPFTAESIVPEIINHRYMIVGSVSISSFESDPPPKPRKRNQ